MDPFELTETQAAIRDAVRELARKEFAPRAAKLDEAGEFPMENFRKLAEVGLCGIPVPEQHGGAGADSLSFTLALEEVAKACGSTCLTLAAHTSLGTMPLVLFGNERLKTAYVPPNARGETIGAYGLTEPGAGSDSGATQTRAVKVDGGWKINGAKI
ncbi:MAG TPA: acyl-CoA dehydrogenase family protein, partial [Planctomycetota bacterium]|nr:acyl-CoA dehydrogenase family protein [Planctomycetota bacterium]